MAAAAAQNQDFAGVGKSPSLTASLERAHRLAVERTHGVVTLEHLLLSLTEDLDASAVFAASPVDLGRLRGDLADVLVRVPPPEVAGRAILPNADLLRVLRLAATAAQQSQRSAIDGMIVLAAIIGDGKTAGAQMLAKHGLTFNEVIRVLQSTAQPRAAAPAAPQQAQVPPPVVQPPRMVAPPTPPVPPVPQTVTAPVPAAAAPPPPPIPGPPLAEPAGAKAQSTEDLLASVRARLQESSPPARPPVATGAPAKPVSPPPVPGPHVSEASDPAMPETPIPPPVQAPTERPIEALAQQPQPMTPRVPPRLNPAPVPLGRLEQTRPESVAAAETEESLAPMPEPVAPPIAARSGPPPLPTVAAFREPGVPEAGVPNASATPPPPRNNPAAPGTMQAPPPIQGMALPLPTVDLAELADGLPEDLQKGVVNIVEVAVPRRVFELGAPVSPPRPGAWPPMRVATMRLFAQGDNVIIEPLSPPSLWLRIWRGPGDPESVIWRWRVLPRSTGTVGLSLTFGVRTVGPDGVGQEALWPEETVGVRVRGGRGKRLLVAGLFLAALLGGGYAGLNYAGKADLVTKPVAGLWQSITGKK